MGEAETGADPVLVRLAGLPAGVLAPFSSAACVRELRALGEVREALARARGALADRLHAAVPEAPAPLRRVLLAARRDGFNGRPFLRYRELPEWPALHGIAGAEGEAVAALERRLTAADSSYREVYERERRREREHLLAVLGHPGLVRGIALASPVAAENLHRLRGGGGGGRKETRLEATLLRYLTRAAFKLSPYSTLTRLGLGEVRAEAPPGAAVLQGSGWEERSLVRVKRYLLDQLGDLLVRYPPFREGLTVVLNDTVQPVAEGRYRFLKPGGWDLDEASGELRFQLASLVKVSMSGPVVSWLLSELPGRRLTFGELGRRLSEQAAPETLLKLVRIGFLCLLPPWPADAPHQEVEILDALRALPDEPGLAAVAEILARLVALETGFAESADPARAVGEMERLAGELGPAAAPLAGFPEAPRGRRTGNLYEDVFVRTASPRKTLLKLPRPAAEDVCRSLAPLVRLLGLYSYRHDFLWTLGTFMARRWPGRRQVGALELFDETQPLWQAYMRFVREATGPDGSRTFDPLELPGLAELKALREETWSRLASSLEPGPARLVLPRAALLALLERVPDVLAPGVGGCAFLQPADATGRTWVVNRLFEGTGRYGSRFTAVMDPEMRRAYTAHLAERGWNDRGEELLDLTWPLGDTLNVHALQTRRVLQRPGQRLDLPADRRVSLADLSVQLPEGGGPPRLVDGRGRRLCPVHLGGAGYQFMPTPLKILALFGPGEMRFTFPPRPGRKEGDVTVRDRLVLDDLVLLRKRWMVPPGELLGNPGGDAEAFAALDRWRSERALPDRVFLIERVHHEAHAEMYKPQYLDFTSPSMVAMLRQALRHNAQSLTFEELLPTPEMAPRDADGCSWAAEIQLDELALRPRPASPETVYPLAATPVASDRQSEPIVAH